jgi:hypothetical protein
MSSEGPRVGLESLLRPSPRWDVALNTPGLGPLSVTTGVNPLSFLSRLSRWQVGGSRLAQPGG